MICRIWHGWTSPADADAYERLLRSEIFQGIVARDIPGYQGIELLRRPVADTVEFVTLMWFDSIDAVRAFAGTDYEVAVVPAAARALLQRFDARSAHYEVRQARAVAPAAASAGAASWEEEIRSLEEQARLAFLQADTDTLTRLWADDFTVNSPHEGVHQKAQVLSLLAAGRIRHTIYECEIEQVSRHGDVVVVMGRDRVTDPPDGALTRRRYTNVWQLREGRWRAIARHAQVATRGGAGP
jgi:heme-degrading monooxygenase HmoA/ketosteroid isomerase-like protein